MNAYGDAFGLSIVKTKADVLDDGSILIGELLLFRWWRDLWRWILIVFVLEAATTTPECFVSRLLSDFHYH